MSNDNQSLFAVLVPERAAKNQNTSELSQEDEELLAKFGFSSDRAKLRLRRMRGELTDEEAELLDEEEEDLRTPSQRGFGAVVAEFDRMGLTFDD